MSVASTTAGLSNGIYKCAIEDGRIVSIFKDVTSVEDKGKDLGKDKDKKDEDEGRDKGKGSGGYGGGGDGSDKGKDDPDDDEEGADEYYGSRVLF